MARLGNITRQRIVGATGKRPSGSAALIQMRETRLFSDGRGGNRVHHPAYHGTTGKRPRGKTGLLNASVSATEPLILQEPRSWCDLP